MKITASVDSKLGDKNLERGKTYDISVREAKHLIRSGLGRKSTKNAKVEKTVQAAQVDVPEGFEPGEESAPTGTAGGNTTVTESNPSSTPRGGKTSGKAGK